MNVNTALDRARATVLKIDAEGAEVSLVSAVQDWSQVRAVVLEYHSALLGDTTGAGLRRLVAYLQARLPRVRVERSGAISRCFLVAAAR